MTTTPEPKLFIPVKQQSAYDTTVLPTAFRTIERWANQLSFGGGGGTVYYASLTGPGETVTPGALTQAGNFTVNANSGSLSFSGGAGGLQVNSAGGYPTMNVQGASGGSTVAFNMDPIYGMAMVANNVPQPSGTISIQASILLQATASPTYAPGNIVLNAYGGAYQGITLWTGSRITGSGQQGIQLNAQYGDIYIYSTGVAQIVAQGNVQLLASNTGSPIYIGSGPVSSTAAQHQILIWSGKGNPTFSPLGVTEADQICDFYFDVAGGHIWANTSTTTTWRQITT